VLSLLYLHGFNSSSASHKGQELRRHLEGMHPRPRLFLPDLPHRPAQAIALAERLIREAAGGEVVLVGSSLGGYYATWLAERHGLKAVLVNPAVRPARDLSAYLGPLENLYTHERWELTPEHVAELEALAVPAVTRPERYYLLAQTGDEVLDWREAAAFYAGARQLVIDGGDHGFQDFGMRIPGILQFAGWRGG
jgi:predicted esterase YcpF (UPF0227 family)